MYQALYRKWRPQTFDEVIGQEHITETLKSQVRNNRLSHAYLFIGTRGTGKTTCARILARAVNCEHPQNGNPCGQCSACRGILSGEIMDVVEMDAASNNSVDRVRALRDEAIFSPANTKKRVYIIDEVHMLSTSAFNALLKIMEEPPEHLLFILATTELQKVPATILSRCQRHSFRRLESSLIAEYLMNIAEKENFALTDEAAQLIARLADGGVRDALSLLDQCSAQETIDLETVYQTVGLAGKRRISELLKAVLKKDSEAALTLFSELWLEGKDPSSALGELNTLLRDILMLKVAPKAGLNLISGGYELAVLQDFAAQMTGEEILAAMGTVQGTLGSMKDAKNARTSAELCLVTLCSNPGGDSFASLRARISRLEESVERGLPMVEPSRTSSVPMAEPVPEEEELEIYQEEQPEDVFLKRQEPVPPSSEQAVPSEEAKDQDLWLRIRANVLPMLPFGERMNVEDENRVSGFVQGSILVLEAENPFLAGRLQKQDLLQKFSDAARTVCGRDLRVLVREKQADTRKKRSLEELKQFKEVHFISE